MHKVVVATRHFLARARHGVPIAQDSGPHSGRTLISNYYFMKTNFLLMELSPDFSL
jgi:hypothetical protein